MVDPGSERVNGIAAPSLAADDALLDAALAALGHRREGYRLRRAGARTRLRRRVADLGIGDEEYLTLLRASRAERLAAWRALLPAGGRLWREPRLWEMLAHSVLPTLGAARPETRIWVAEAGSCMEAWTLALLWQNDARTRKRPVRIVATDSRTEVLEEGRRAEFPLAAARGLPAELRQRWLVPADGRLLLASELRPLVAVAAHDLARDPWPFEVDLLLLRNASLQRWGAALHEEVLKRAASSLVSHGWLALNARDRLSESEQAYFVPAIADLPLYRKRH